MVAVDPLRPNVRLRVHDVDVLRYLYPEWDALDKADKLKLIQNTGASTLKRTQTHNVTCVKLHEFLAQCVNPEEPHNEEGDAFAFGDDATAFSASDTSLNNKIGQTAITNVTTDADTQETTFTTFVDSSELNGNTLAEIGLISDSGNLWNHAAISPTIDKTSSETVIAEIFLGFSN